MLVLALGLFLMSMWATMANIIVITLYHITFRLFDRQITLEKRHMNYKIGQYREGWVQKYSTINLKRIASFRPCEQVWDCIDLAQNWAFRFLTAWSTPFDSTLLPCLLMAKKSRCCHHGKGRGLKNGITLAKHAQSRFNLHRNRHNIDDAWNADPFRSPMYGAAEVQYIEMQDFVLSVASRLCCTLSWRF